MYLVIALVDVGTTIFIHLVIINKSVLYGELARLTDLDGFSDTSTATVIGMIIGIIFILLFVAMAIGLTLTVHGILSITSAGKVM